MALSRGKSSRVIRSRVGADHGFNRAATTRELLEGRNISLCAMRSSNVAPI